MVPDASALVVQPEAAAIDDRRQGQGAKEMRENAIAGHRP